MKLSHLRTLAWLPVAVVIGAAAWAFPTAAALASGRRLAVLLTIQQPIRGGLDWQVLGSGGKVLGSASEVCNTRKAVCRFHFKLPHGTLRMTWRFVERHHTFELTAAPITGGSGRYAGARGYASVGAVGPGGTLSRNLTGAQYIQVVFHLG